MRYISSDKTVARVGFLRWKRKIPAFANIRLDFGSPSTYNAGKVNTIYFIFKSLERA